MLTDVVRCRAGGSLVKNWLKTTPVASYMTLRAGGGQAAPAATF
jgi:hypothetical protein